MAYDFDDFIAGAQRAKDAGDTATMIKLHKKAKESPGYARQQAREARAAGDTEGARDNTREYLALKNGRYEGEKPLRTEPAVPPTDLENAARKSNLFIQGVGAGVADTAGLVGDIGQMIPEEGMFGKVAEMAVGGSKLGDMVAGGLSAIDPTRQLRKGFDQAPTSQGIKDAASGAVAGTWYAPTDYEDMTSGERKATRGVEFATANVIPAVALASKAKAMAAGGKELGGILNAYAKSPARAVATDAASGVGAGAALEFAKDKGVDSGAGQMAAIMAGAVGGGMGASAALRPDDFARSLKGLAPTKLEGSTGYVSNRRADAGAERLRETVSGRPDGVVRTHQENVDLAADTLDKGITFSKDNGLPMSSSGVMTRDLGLTTFDKSVRAGADSLYDAFTAKAGPTGGRVAYMKKDAELANAAARTLTDGQNPTFNPAPLQSAVAAEKDAVVGTAVRGVENAEQSVTAARQAREAQAAPVSVEADAATRAGYAADIEKNLRASTETMTKRKNELYDIGDAERAVVVDATPLARVAAELQDSLSIVTPEASQVPREFIQRLERMMEGGSMQTNVGNLLADNVYLAHAIRNAPAGEVQLKKNLEAVKDTIGGMLKQQPQLGAANKFFAEEYAPLFRQKDANETFQRGIIAGKPQDPSQIAKEFTRTPENINRFNRVVGADPATAGPGVQAVDNFLVSDASRAALTPDGVVSPDKVAAFQARHSDRLAQSPGAQQRVSDLADEAQILKGTEDISNEALRAAKETRMVAEGAFNRSASNLLGKAVDVRSALGKILQADEFTSTAQLKDLKRVTSSDPAAAKSLSDALMDVLVSQTNAVSKDVDIPGVQISAAKIHNMLRKHNQVMKEVLSPDQFKALENSSEILRPFRDLDAAKTAGMGSTTQGNEKLSAIGRSLAFFASGGNAIQASAKATTAKKLVSLVPGASPAIAALTGKNMRLEKMLRDSNLSPEMMSALLRRKVAEPVGPLRNDGLNFQHAQKPNDQEDQAVRDAILRGAK
jgi:hypothetical protein